MRNSKPRGVGGAAARGAAHAQYGGASRGLGQRLAGRSRCAAAALLPAARTARLGSALSSRLRSLPPPSCHPLPALAAPGPAMAAVRPALVPAP